MQSNTATPPLDSFSTDRRKFLISALNGTAIYVLAYYLVWGLHQLAKLEVSRFYHLRGTWDPSRIVYTLADAEWMPNIIVAVYGVGPLACLLVGAVALRWFWTRERARRGHLKLLLLWVVFHCCNAVFGALLADTFTRSGFWYVPDWLFGLGNVVNVLLALLAGLTQLAQGYFAAVAFLQAHDSRTVMRHANRRLMVASTLAAPWVAGSAFIVLAKLPYLTVHEGLHLVMMGLLVMPLALACLNEAFSETVQRPLSTRLAWGLMALGVLVAVTWRFALGPPIAFG